MTGERELRRALERVEVPGEEDAERRAWEVVRTAYERRTPSPSRSRAGVLALAAAAVAALVFGLSPAGAKVGDLVADVGEAMGIGVDDARPSLRSLPAAGELLVDSGDGIWIVRRDGSKRRLGDYEDGAWSPRGLFVAVTDGSGLLAVEPDGTIRWSVEAAGRVRDPRWSPSGFRIAYRAGSDLWMVAGDGTGARRVAAGVAPRPPAWRPAMHAKLTAGGAGAHVLSYLDGDGIVRTVDVDTGRRVAATDADRARVGPPAEGPGVAAADAGVTAAISPDGRARALSTREGRRARLVVRSADDGPARVLFSGPGRFTAPVWSPGGEWLLIGWRDADQWLFIDPAERRKPVAIDTITAAFGSGDGRPARFPRPLAWALPRR